MLLPGYRHRIVDIAVRIEGADEFPDSRAGQPTGVSEIGRVRTASKTGHQRAGQILFDRAASSRIPNAEGLVNRPDVQINNFGLDSLRNRGVPVRCQRISVKPQRTVFAQHEVTDSTDVARAPR